MDFLSDARIVSEALQAYYRQSLEGAGPVIRQLPLAQIVSDLELPALVRDGGLTGERLLAEGSFYLSTASHGDGRRAPSGRARPGAGRQPAGGGGLAVNPA